jgi:hypothetical protein
LLAYWNIDSPGDAADKGDLAYKLIWHSEGINSPQSITITFYWDACPLREIYHIHHRECSKGQSHLQLVQFSEYDCILRTHLTFLGGLLHDLGDQPAVMGFGIDGATTLRFQNGVLHHATKPAYQDYMRDHYYQQGVLHRDPKVGPAVYEYDDDDQDDSEVEEYYQHGQHIASPHNEEKEL